MNKSVDVNNEKAPYETSKQSKHTPNTNHQWFICDNKWHFFSLFQIDNDVQKSTTTKSSEDESSNDDTEEEDSLGKVLTKAGKEIDRKSAGNVRRSKEEAKADEEPENEFGYTDS